MDYVTRMERLRDFGPRRPVLRFVLHLLAHFDLSGTDYVYGGTLEAVTGYSDRAIRAALRELVIMGWLEPEELPSATLPPTRNQHGVSAKPRVHGHLGGCRPGGQGEKTRYRVIYRDHPADEAPSKRKNAKRNRAAPASPIEGGTGRHKTGGSTPPVDPTTGNGAPARGNGAPNKGEPRSPDREGNVIDRDGGGITPLPPHDGVNPAGSLLGADAPQGPQDGLPGAVAPDLDPEAREAGRQLQARWSDALRALRDASPDATAIRLWLDSPKVRPTHCAGEVLHVACPSATWAARVAAYADQLCPLLAVRSLVCHHPASQEAA